MVASEGSRCPTVTGFGTARSAVPVRAEEASDSVTRVSGVHDAALVADGNGGFVGVGVDGTGRRANIEVRREQGRLHWRTTVIGAGDGTLETGGDHGA